MKLEVELLAHYLAQEDAQILFPQLQLDAKEIVQLQCYQTLCRIQEIVRDDTLEDTECFERIERIVSEFERIGSNGGGRHDFG